jgi:inner membrane transporter RhtA
MVVALLVVSPFGLGPVIALAGQLALVPLGLAVGVCSIVIPYGCDQVALARMPKATFALMLCLLPATAAVIGLVVLQQLPTTAEALGIALVVVGVAIHEVPGSEPGAELTRQRIRR